MRIPRNAHEAVIRIAVGKETSPALLRRALKSILPMEDNIIRTSLMSALLNGVMVRGPKKPEVVALLNAIFEYCEYAPFSLKPEITGKRLIAVTGSGKKGYKTLNISSGATLLAAGLGCYVVKPCSSSASSMTGSADFFMLAGVNLDQSSQEVVDLIRETGVFPLRVERLIEKFDFAYGGRFFAPHALSFGLPPLLCDISYDFLLYGLAHPNVKLSAEVLSSFGIRNAIIFSSTDDDLHFVDEMGIFGSTRLVGIIEGKVGTVRHVEPTEMLGLPRFSSRDIKEKGSPIENVTCMLKVLAGRASGELQALEDIVCINAANILFASSFSKDLVEGFKTCKDAVKSGVGFDKLKEIAAKSGGNTGRPDDLLKMVKT